ncbi:fungal specific transcription factor domain-containing protein [Phanerochaete sordida]|uniref:Fungal specific transcription factor domain-containing protein n=1 Tax=Phanerochaete sordida TaxID=48140 RepID=A0A9P3G1T1_9APHY|nr:fungal specific transcription factor domain-containing protein [Phanerochaete sordida]
MDQSVIRPASSAGNANCDSQRPCSTCVKSHAYARAHAAEGIPIPEEPDCTYGDEKEKEQLQSASKVQRLEGRISELETLLSEMQLALDVSRSPSTALSPSSYSISQMAGPSCQSMSPSNTLSPHTNGSHYYDTTGSYEDDMALAVAAVYSRTPSSLVPHTEQNAVVTVTNSRKAQLRAMGWPEQLPDPLVAKHLVHAFFAFNMHAGRLFHGPTFLASLNLHPTDPRFPMIGVLHAMCAVGSLYTADIPQPPMQPRAQQPYNGQFFHVDELFHGRWRAYERRPDSFSEEQARRAKTATEEAVDLGDRLVECLQAQTILTWFYLIQARWAESYTSSGQSLRCVPPCGLSIAAPFQCMTDAVEPGKTPAIIHEAKTVIEDETRRNVFWITYALERQAACGHSFAMAMDDLDVCQLLPVRGDTFEQGLPVDIRERQWSHDKRMFLSHVANQTDSFVLFIKTSLLLSEVKNFGLRYRGRYYRGETSMYAPNQVLESPATYDPRPSPAFKELDALIAAFRPSFPPNLRNPVQDEMVDAYLYAANCGAYLAQILLHEPHTRMTSLRDPSVPKLLAAARNILDLMYAISATSYDLSLLDHLPILAWNGCGRVLIRALRVAIDTDNLEQSLVLQAEIAFVHSMLSKAGERMPLAYRYKKMVYDFLANHCGPQYVESLPQTSYHQGRFPSPNDGFYPAAPPPGSGTLYAGGMYTADDLEPPAQMHAQVPRTHLG